MNEERQVPTLVVCFGKGLQRVKGPDWRKAGSNSRCPFQGGVHLIESQRNMLKNERDQLKVSILGSCRPYRDAHKNTKA